MKSSFSIINPEEIPSQVNNGDTMMEFDQIQQQNEHSDWPEMQVDELSTVRPWMAEDHGPVFGGHGSDTLFAEASTCFTSNFIKDKSTQMTGAHLHDPAMSKLSTPFLETDGSSDEHQFTMIESAFDPLPSSMPASKASHHQKGFITPTCREPNEDSCPQHYLLLQASA